MFGKREPVALLSWSSWSHMIVVWLFLAVPWVCLQFVIVVLPDHTPLLLNPTKPRNEFTCQLVISLWAYSILLTLSGLGCNQSYPRTCPGHSRLLKPMQHFEGLILI